MHARHARVAQRLPPQGDVSRHARDAGASALRDALDGLGDAAGAVGGGEGALLLDVQVLGVLAHDDEVDGRAGGAPRRGDGADVGVQVEGLAQRDDGRRVAGNAGAGRADGAEEGAVAFGAQGGDCGGREGGPGLLEGLEAGGEGDEGEA